MKKIALVADTFPPTNTSAAIQLENLSRQLALMAIRWWSLFLMRQLKKE